MKCHKCNRSPATHPNLVLKRANPTGEKGIWECSPTCGVTFIGDSAAVLHALDNKEENDLLLSGETEWMGN